MNNVSAISSKIYIFILLISMWFKPTGAFSQCKLHLKDLNNNEYKIIKNTINVFVFLDTECPISQQYVRNLETLRLAFSQKNIQFWAVFPTKGVTKDEIIAFQEKYDFQYSSVIDYNMKLTKKLDAKTTPEVFIVNNKNRILYRGAIDDLYYDLGKKRPEASIFYLKDALNNIINKQKITIQKTEAIGCDIER